VALIACREADEEGNVAFGRFPFTDRLIALAARSLVVQVENVASAGELADRAPGETLPGFLVSAVVVMAGGCHPTGSPGHYARDEGAIGSYLRAARDPSSLSDWLDEVVLGGDEETYVSSTQPGSVS
jgi:glutaconate CoA-transferase subunit A